MAKYVDVEAAKVILRDEGVLDDITFLLECAPAADVEPVRHGHWAHRDTHMWFRRDDGEVDIWMAENEFHNGPECQVCHATPCIHCHPDWEVDKCKLGYYVCSACGAESADDKKNFCPNCGAKMGKEAKEDGAV